MTIDELIAEIKSDFKRYDNAGLLDDVDLYKWSLEALKPFGNNVTEKTETVLQVNGGYGQLPDGFFSLYLAYKCEPVGYHIGSGCDRDKVQQSWMWTERVEHGVEWNSCDPSCFNENKKIIKESVYIDLPNDEGIGNVDFYYNEPHLLRLGGNFRKNNIHKECRNRLVKDSEYEIYILSRTLQTNFDSGTVYVQYYGFPTDDNGLIMIPDTARGELERYVEYYLKMKVLEKVVSNGYAQEAGNLLQYYATKEMQHKSLALTDTKFSRITPRDLKKIAIRNRKQMIKYELMMPR